MAVNGGIKGKVNKPSHGGNTVTTFTSSGSFTAQQGTTQVDVLTVAGGGSGGASTSGQIMAGGGGAGGFQNLTGQPINSGDRFAVTVGAGGAAAPAPASSNVQGNDGSDSVWANPVSPITSTGGGGGGGGEADDTDDGRPGGSGGGAAYAYNAGSVKGDGTSGQGNDGGISSLLNAGGGGGAGAAGQNGGTATSYEAGGDGGIGSPSTITGTSTYYAGGGGGASYGKGTGTPSPAGGAGARMFHGQGGDGGGGFGNHSSHPSAHPSGGASGAGTANTGGGGGGGAGVAPGAVDSDGTGAAGGSGIVIVKEKDKASGVWNMKNQYSSKLKGQWPDPNQYEITNSCRFDGSTDQLQRTPSHIGNKKTFTWSAWVKRCGEDSDFFIGGGTSSSVYVGIGFQSDQLKYYDQSSGVLANKQTNAKFRDPAAWYHIVAEVDTTQATASERIKLYVNGQLQTSFTTNVIPSQNQDLYFGQANIISIGTIHYTAGNVDYHNGHVSDVHFIDGKALHCGHFGEPDPDSPSIWRAKKYEGTFGSNGFKLEFKQTGTSANSSGIGADTSGNDNHFSVVNLASIDITEDTPTNNFVTFNPLANRPSYETTFTQGNTDADFDDSNYGIALTTQAVTSGKWYAEFKIIAVGGTVEVGVSDPTQTSTTISTKYRTYMQTGQKENDDYSNRASYGDTFTANDIIGVAMDLDNGDIYFYKNGTIQNSGTAAFTDLDSAIPVSGWCFYAFGFNDAQVQLNTGNPPFSISSGNADGNGYGNFEYSVPSGYYALCTKNLAQYG